MERRFSPGRKSPSHDAALSLLLSPGRILLHIRGLNGVSGPPWWPRWCPRILRTLLRHWTVAVNLGAALAGTFVNRILDLNRSNVGGRWALLFGIRFVWLMISVASMVFVRENRRLRYRMLTCVEPSGRSGSSPRGSLAPARDPRAACHLNACGDICFLRRPGTPDHSRCRHDDRHVRDPPGIGSAATRWSAEVLIDRVGLGGDPCRHRSRKVWRW